MKIAMINGSPKRQHNVSGILLEELKTCDIKDADFKDFHLNKQSVDNETFSTLSKCDVFVFAYPLYVDGIPSHLLSCLHQIEKAGIDNKNIMVFCIVNSGFYEGKQNSIAIEILKNWCSKVGLQWGIGIGLGGGAGLGQMNSCPLGTGVKKSLGNAYNALKNSIETKTPTQDIYISINFPRLLYKQGAEMGWKQLIKGNGGNTSDLNRRY